MGGSTFPFKPSLLSKRGRDPLPRLKIFDTVCMGALPRTAVIDTVSMGRYKFVYRRKIHQSSGEIVLTYMNPYSQYNIDCKVVGFLQGSKDFCQVRYMCTLKELYNDLCSNESHNLVPNLMARKFFTYLLRQKIGASSNRKGR